MTGYFEHQDRARRTTRLLVVLMALGVIAMGSTIYLLLQWLSGIAHGGAPFRPGLLFATLLGTGLLVLLASVSRVLSLRGGGGQIAEMLGGRLVSGSPRDVLEKRLLNVVEEMAIASGVPVPQVFVLDGETGINAFAAGLELSEELQGVIAHEFSHVLNGDMRLNIRLMGIVFGIVCIGLFGRLLMRLGTPSRFSSSRDEKSQSGVPILLLGLGVVVVGWIGEFFGTLIKAAVSRQREFLADASAVQFTRNPHGIAGALKKIGGFSRGGRVGAGRAGEASHFFFSEIAPGALVLPLLATHPPLTERVRRIDPSFRGEFPEVGPGIAEPEDASPLGLVPRGEGAAFDPARVIERVGEPSAASMQCGQRLLEAIPADLRAAIEAPFSACAAVYALLLSDRPEVQQTQRGQIETLAGPELWPETLRLSTAVAGLPRRERLPFVELLAPALRSLSRDQRASFGQTVQALIDADERVSIFEYVLSHTLADRLAGKARSSRVGARQRSLLAVRAELALLLSLLAHAGDSAAHAAARGQGAADGQGAAGAFASAASRLHGLPLELLPRSRRLLSGLSAALEQLRMLTPELAQQVVDACAHAVLADRIVTEDEVTLLRAVCGALNCPLPPFSELGGG
jgi:Zn-dependent protease with chaperone function